jgi:UPF0042 nucleotide-binding protein
VTLEEAIAREREALEMLASLGPSHRHQQPAAECLARQHQGFRRAGDAAGMTLLFESFGFKHGIPLDADLVFDVRCLPNPHYDPPCARLPDATRR